MSLDVATSLYFALAGVCLAAAAVLAYTLTRNSLEAARELAKQYEPATQSMIHDLLSDATQAGRGTLVGSMLRHVQVLYGKDAIKAGHIEWVLKVLEGRVPAGDLPPSFRHW